MWSGLELECKITIVLKSLNTYLFYLAIDVTNFGESLLSLTQQTSPLLHVVKKKFVIKGLSALVSSVGLSSWQ